MCQKLYHTALLELSKLARQVEMLRLCWNTQRCGGVVTHNAVQTLNAIKLELSNLLAEQAKLEKEKRERLAQRESFAADLDAATHEHAKIAATVRRLTLEQQDSDQPKILDYIRLKHDNMVRPCGHTLLGRLQAKPVGAVGVCAAAPNVTIAERKVGSFAVRKQVKLGMSVVHEAAHMRVTCENSWH